MCSTFVDLRREYFPWTIVDVTNFTSKYKPALINSVTENNTPHDTVIVPLLLHINESIIFSHCVHLNLNKDTDSMPFWMSALIVTILPLSLKYLIIEQLLHSNYTTDNLAP